jgi:osmoprotectant transport system permease protein
VTVAGLTIAQASSDFFRDRSDSDCIRDNGAFCASWVLDNFDRYVDPFREHVVLVGVSVGLGFLIAFAMALASHRRRWLVPPFIGATGALYTIPSLAFCADTAIIALTAFTLQIIYRNIVAGLAGVPGEAKDAGRGMGMTDRQLLWQIELPLAVPEIIAGVRVATVSTVAIASLAVFAGGGGLGSELIAGSNFTFRTGVVTASALLIGLAIAFDVLLLMVQRRLTRWRSAGEARASRRAGFLRTLARSRPRSAPYA